MSNNPKLSDLLTPEEITDLHNSVRTKGFEIISSMRELLKLDDPPVNEDSVDE